MRDVIYTGPDLLIENSRVIIAQREGIMYGQLLVQISVKSFI